MLLRHRHTILQPKVLQPKVHLFVEKSIVDIVRAVSFASSVEVDGDGNVGVYLTEEKTLLAIAFLAAQVGAEVYRNGERVEVEL